jgi:hypothetical protein
MSEERKWYKDQYLWRNESPGWQIDKYGFEVNGLGDIIFNTMYKVAEEDDKSEWAYEALSLCKELLTKKVRWPSSYTPEIGVAKNWFDWKWKVLLYKLKLNKVCIYRPRENITRDPYIAFYYACVKLGKFEYIDEVRIPSKLYTPEVFRWRNKLIKAHRKDYVRRLRVIRAKATIERLKNTYD